MSALLEVTGICCDYCSSRVDFPNPGEPPALMGWTVGTFDDDGNSTIVPIDLSVFTDVDPLALVACPKEECQKSIRLPENIPVVEGPDAEIIR